MACMVTKTNVCRSLEEKESLAGHRCSLEDNIKGDIKILVSEIMDLCKKHPGPRS